jgi:hypothetical protein
VGARLLRASVGPRGVTLVAIVAIVAGCGGSSKTVTATTTSTTTASTPRYSSSYPPAFEQQWQTSCNANPQQYASAAARRRYCTCALTVLEGSQPYSPGTTAIPAGLATEVLRKCAGIG